MDISEAWKYQRERVESFYRALFGVNVGAMLFFLVVKPGPALPATLPFGLGPFFPFECEVVALAILSAITLILRSINLLLELGKGLRWLRYSGILLLIVSVGVIVWAGVGI